RQVPRGIPVSLPGGRHAPETPASLPSPNSLNLQYGRAVLLPLLRMHPARTSPPSTPAASGILFPLPARLCTTLPSLPPALDSSAQPEHTRAGLPQAARWERFRLRWTASSVSHSRC